MTVVAPMLIVSMRGLDTNPAGLIRGTVEAALTGVVLALLGMGYAVWSRSPRAAA